MKPTRTWVLIADGGNARILAQEGRGKALVPVEGMTFSRELPKTSDMVRDRQPRAFDSVGKGRHHIDVGLDPHRKEKEKFAVELAGILDGEAGRKAFDRLVIVAPAKAMGEIRAALSAPVRAKLHKELVKDLTRTPDTEIASHLDDVLT